MSNCIKGLYGYELVKKCCRYGIISLKTNFHTRSKSKDGYRSACKICEKKFYLDNQDREKKDYLDNRDRRRD